MNQLLNSLRDELASACTFLPDKPHENADSTLRALWLTAAGQPRAIGFLSDSALPPLDQPGIACLKTLVSRRICGVPLAHLTGREAFMGLELLAGPEALIPRAETELVANCTLDIIREILKENPAPQIIDLCSGSGNIALALAYHAPSCHVVASDISESAINLARRNARHLALEDRVEFYTGDLFAPFDSSQLQADLVVANPPYISSKRLGVMPEETALHEPREAFDGGPFGLSVVARIIADTPKFLKPGMWLCMEVGLGQAKGLSQVCARNGNYTDIRMAQDDKGFDRVMMARVKPTAS